ncbi:MAG: hypothetical protein J5921_00095 [Clostridia bacterium]|nr:hypothetical protein [Clostridia bacterium]
MKKLLVTGFITILLAFVLISCGKGNNQTIATPGIGDTTPAPTVTPAPTPAIESAADYLSKKYVIERSKGAVTNPKTGMPEPGEYYSGYTPNYRSEKYDMLMLDREQSRRILEADDIGDITYLQSECLPIMLLWDDVSVIDVYSYLLYKGRYAYKAFYYYLDDRTVIILNDAAKTSSEYVKDEKAWIAVVPKGEEDSFPFEIPPMGTHVSPDSENKGEYEQYYNDLRAYFMKDSKFVAVNLPPKVYEDHVKDYLKWIDWRTEHPEKYAEWKELSVPEKQVVYQGGNEYWKLGSAPVWFSSYKSETGDTGLVENNPEEYPYIYYEIKRYGIPKEEMLEFVKWQNWSEYYEYSSMSYDDVEVLYSDDQDLMRRNLKSSSAWYYDGELYTKFQILNCIPEYDIAQMFTEDSFAEYCEKVSNTCWESELNRLAELRDSWNVYEQTVNADAGVLNTASAVRVLEGFMMLYEELKYSPDVLAGELASKYYEGYGKDEYGVFFHVSNKSESRIKCEMRTVLTKAARAEFGDFINMSWDEQFYIDLWNYVPGALMVSADPRFYNGPIELFDSGYTLSDHIEIVSSDDEHAKVTLTARSRSGSGELSYDVLFTKVGGIWYISGGTLLDLL